MQVLHPSRAIHLQLKKTNHYHLAMLSIADSDQTIVQMMHNTTFTIVARQKNNQNHLCSLISESNNTCATGHHRAR